MSFPIPDIDDRSYREILDEAMSRIRVHNPEWTNFNDSDPGITLLQLFAFMTESMLYRANRVPERNRKKFLDLLGIPMRPATPAQGLVSFGIPRGALEARVLQEDLPLFAGQTPFRTLDGLSVLPIEMRAYYKERFDGPEEGASEVETLVEETYDGDARPYKTQPLDPPADVAGMPALDLQRDTIDSALWLAVLARSKQEVEATREVLANEVLTLGIVPAPGEGGRRLPAGGSEPSRRSANLVFERPRVEGDRPVAQYQRVEAVPSGNLLVDPGTVQLRMPPKEGLVTWENTAPVEAETGGFPPYLDDTNVVDRLITWIRVRPAGSEASGGRTLRARISLVAANAARVVQRARVVAEPLGKGTGEADQSVALANTPVIEDSVELTVDGERWKPIEDLAVAGGEISGGPGSDDGATPKKVYTVDRATGEVRFGDGLRGMRPPRGAVIRASYAYGGGSEGKVGIGAISKGPALPSGVKVTNPVPTWGGEEAETAEEAQKRMSQVLRHRERLVSEEDFVEITKRTPGVDVARADVLPLFHPDPERSDLAAEGMVTIMVVPRDDPQQPEAPTPDDAFLRTVCDHLEPRRLVTTELHVRGPRYKPVYVSVGIDTAPDREIAPVQEAVRKRVRAFLSPLRGGFEGEGWPLEHDVDRTELLTVVARVPGVRAINELRVGEADSETSPISITGLDLPHLKTVAVEEGGAPPLDDVRGDRPEEPEGPAGPDRPVPEVPGECQ